MAGGDGVTAQVAVVGAGPAGCSAAISLAAEGVDVLLLDEACLPRQKVCGDGLSPHCMAELCRMGLSALADRAYQATTAHVVAPNRQAVSLVTSSVGGLMRRADFDAALVEHARARGARLVLGAKAVRIARNSDGISVETAEGRTVRAVWGILATGAGPQGLRAAGLADGLAPPGAIGRRAYFEGVELPPRTILFDYARHLLPTYGWMFSLGDGLANVGVMTFVRRRRQGPPLSALFEEFVRRSDMCWRFLSRARQVGPAGSAPLRMGFEGGRLGEGRLLVAGDAASCANPLTGEGILGALVTGRLAAQCIVRALRGDVPAARIPTDYRSAVRRAFAREYSHARLMRCLMAWPAVTNRFVRASKRHAGLGDALAGIIVGGASPLGLLAPGNLVRLLA